MEKDVVDNAVQIPRAKELIPAGKKLRCAAAAYCADNVAVKMNQEAAVSADETFRCAVVGFHERYERRMRTLH
jgi:hypothetical protein